MNTLTTAIYEHRDFVPFDYIAITFARLEFTGKDADKYNEEWKKIERKIKESSYAILKKIEVNEKKIEENNKILKRKPWYRFRDNEEEAVSRKEIEKLRVENSILEEEYDELDTDFDLRCAIERFLGENHFAMVRRDTRGDECCTYTDIYELRS